MHLVATISAALLRYRICAPCIVTLVIMCGFAGGPEPLANAQALKEQPTAKELVARALKLAETIQDARERRNLLVEIAETQCALGDDRGALATGALIPPEADKKQDFNHLIHIEVAKAQIADRRFESAQRILETIPSGFTHEVGASMISVALEEAGDQKGAMQTVRVMKGRASKLSAFLKIAALRFKRADQKGAKEVIDEAVRMIKPELEPGEKIDMWVRVGEAQAAVGDQVSARKSFARARKIASEASQEGRDSLYWRIVEGQVSAGEIEAAQETAKLIGDQISFEETTTKDRALCVIARGQAKAGRVPEAERTLSQIRNDSQRAHALALMAEAEVERGDLGSAKQHLLQGRKLAKPDDSVLTTLAMSALAHSLILMKDLEEARSTANLITVGIRDEILKDVVQAECKAGNLPAALKTLHSMKNGRGIRHRDEAARLIAAERTRRQDPETLAWAESLATTSERIYALLGIADGLNPKKK